MNGTEVGCDNEKPLPFDKLRANGKLHLKTGWIG